MAEQEREDMTRLMEKLTTAINGLQETLSRVLAKFSEPEHGTTSAEFTEEIAAIRPPADAFETIVTAGEAATDVSTPEIPAFYPSDVEYVEPPRPTASFKDTVTTAGLEPPAAAPLVYTTGTAPPVEVAPVASSEQQPVRPKEFADPELVSTVDMTKAQHHDEPIDFQPYAESTVDSVIDVHATHFDQERRFRERMVQLHQEQYSYISRMQYRVESYLDRLRVQK